MESDSNNKPVSREWLHRVAAHTNTPKSLLDEAFQDARIYPDAQGWLLFAQRAFLFLGAASLLVGVIFFFAYNWANLHKFIKLGLVQTVIISLIIRLLTSKKFALVEQVLITSLAVLVGVLMVLFGQIYQTGANAYDLFVAWTALITPLVLIGRFPALWIIYLVLLNTSVFLFMEQILDYSDEKVAALILFLVNVSALSIWEASIYLKIWQYDSRLWPRLIAVACIVILTPLLISLIAKNATMSGISVIILLTGLLSYSTGFYFYTNKVKDLVPKVALGLSLIALGASFIILQISNDIEGFFMAGFFCIISTVGLVRWLLRQNIANENQSTKTLNSDESNIF